MVRYSGSIKFLSEWLPAAGLALMGHSPVRLAPAGSVRRKPASWAAIREQLYLPLSAF